jgi:preprotein translocase subunit SecY
MSAFANILKIPELRRRILFTFGLLAIYRLGVFVTTPGVDRNVMRQIMQQQSGSFLGMFNMFTGGALEQLSIFALGIMPYVTASIILQLLTVVIKPLEELRKEGEAGRRKINQYTRYGTIGISIIQSTGISFYLQQLTGSTGANVVRDPGPFFIFLTIVSLTTGTAFIMWLGEQITERGIGNGISLIIFAGIVAELPSATIMTVKRVKLGELQPVTMLMVALLCLIVVAVIVFFERGQRRLPVHYAKRMVGKKVYGGQTSHLPLRVNASGVIPRFLRLR